mgnify:CR=1 FL=1
MKVDTELIRALYNARVIGRYAIAKHIADSLHVTVRFALKKLRTLDKVKDLKLSIEYPLRAFRLKRVAVFIQNEDQVKEFISEVKESKYYPFVRSIILLIPMGIGIVYHLPDNVDMNSIPAPKDAFKIEYDEFLRNMTDFKIYGEDSITKVESATSWRNFFLLAKRLSELNISEDLRLYVARLKEMNNKYDWADLAIIKELEKNPLLSLEDLGKALGMNLHRIRKHIHNHIIPIIRGIRIRYTPVTKELKTFVAIVGRGSSIDAVYAACTEFVRHPLIIGATINLKTNEFILQVYVTSNIAREVIDFFRALFHELNFEFITAFMGVIAKTFSIPFIKFREYIPKIKWVWEGKDEERRERRSLGN